VNVPSRFLLVLKRRAYVSRPQPPEVTKLVCARSRRRAQAPR
jgi:hypothetical protein